MWDVSLLACGGCRRRQLHKVWAKQCVKLPETSPFRKKKPGRKPKQPAEKPAAKAAAKKAPAKRAAPKVKAKAKSAARAPKAKSEPRRPSKSHEKVEELATRGSKRTKADMTEAQALRSRKCCAFSRVRNEMLKKGVDDEAAKEAARKVSRLNVS